MALWDYFNFFVVGIHLFGWFRAMDFMAPIGMIFFVLCYALALAINHAETERERTEAQEGEKLLFAKNLELEKINRMKTNFLRDMKHELRAPLTVISAGIDYTDSLITGEDETAVKVRSALETVRKQTQRVGRMLSGMAILASMSEVQNRERLNFTKLLHECVEENKLALERENNSLILDIASDLPDVFVEKDRFKQAIANLLTNSNEHTKDGEIRISADCDGTYIIVRITDSGTGIPSELLDRVFERGVAGKAEGSGFGLYLCKAIIEAHGGTIAIKSDKQVQSGTVTAQGTEVTFNIRVYGGQEIERGVDGNE
jgi:signal transduction histidine kinase